MRIKPIDKNIVLNQFKGTPTSAASNPTTNNFSNVYTVKMSLIFPSKVHGYIIKLSDYKCW